MPNKKIKNDAPKPIRPKPSGTGFGIQVRPKFNAEGSGYDYGKARAAGIKPDKTGHWPSREPKSGQILKGKSHPTYKLTVEGERKAGHEIYKQGDKYYSRKKGK